MQLASVPHTPATARGAASRRLPPQGRREAAWLRWPCQHQDRVCLLRGPARGRDGHTDLMCQP